MTKSLRKNVLGTIILLSMLLGGGTSSGLLTDSFLQTMMIVGSGFALYAVGGPLDKTLVTAALFMVAVLVIQVVPVPTFLVEAVRAQVLEIPPQLPPSNYQAITTQYFRTLECLTYFSALVMLFLAVRHLKYQEVAGIFPFYLVGLVCNLVIGAIQFSLMNKVPINDFFPYSIQAGVFANANHYGALLFSSLPFLVYYAFERGKKIFSCSAIIVVLLLLLAVGSVAGTLIGGAITLTSLIVMSRKSSVGSYFFIAIFVILAVYGVGVLSSLQEENFNTGHGRWEFARTTIIAIKENFLLGTGFGSFPTIYPAYEKNGMIFREYVNHAHNDYLEVILEGGALAFVALGGYIILLTFAALSANNNRFKQCALLGVVFILLHSAVDYPLRTMTLASIFAFFNGVIFNSAVTKR